MEIIANTNNFILEKETAAAIGKFDGIHIGHRRLLEEILSHKKEGLAACVFTFDPPPSALFGGTDEKCLTTREEKRIVFGRMGVDILIEFPLTKESAAMPPEIFAAEVLAERMKARFVAAGTDLSFGAKGAGDADLLQRLAPELGFGVRTIRKVCLGGREVSSTYVRARVEAGDMEEAAGLLGIPYMIAGNVVSGRRIGRTLGFPTINVLPPENKLLPPNGVYYSRVSLGEKMYRAITNVGCKPTVEKRQVMGVESYLYDFAGDAYGQPAEVYLEAFRRPERRFGSLEELRNQIAEDITAGEIF